jgi:hypothetical protein
MRLVLSRPQATGQTGAAGRAPTPNKRPKAAPVSAAAPYKRRQLVVSPSIGRSSCEASGYGLAHQLQAIISAPARINASTGWLQGA